MTVIYTEYDDSAFYFQLNDSDLLFVGVTLLVGTPLVYESRQLLMGIILPNKILDIARIVLEYKLVTHLLLLNPKYI